MRNKVFMLVAMIVVLIGFISCSSPSKESESVKPVKESEVTDITNVNAASLPSGEIKSDESYKKEVSSVNLAKIPAQFDASLKVLAEKKKKFAESPEDYLFDTGMQVMTNGKKLVENGAEITPIPLYKTWESSKIRTVDDVISWGANSTIVKITGKRKADDGNWYQVKLDKGGFVEMDGWVPEEFLESLTAEGTHTIMPGEGSSPRRGRGGGGGNGGGGGDGGGGGG
jgi:hypothetical protein